jgi:hypothetical protein
MGEQTQPTVIHWVPLEEDGDVTLARLQPHVLKQLIRLGYMLWKTHGSAESIKTLDTEACHQADAYTRSLALQNAAALHEKELVRLQLVAQQKDAEQLQHIAVKDAIHGTTVQCLQTEIDRLCCLLKHTEDTHNKSAIGELQETINKQQDEICRLRNSNSGKGNIGECLVEQMLRHAFPANEIKNTGAIGHSCDISMSDRFGRTVVFESKNRMAVSREDVARFRSDCRNMHDSVQGAVFISLRCPNIPGLGSMAVEIMGVGTKTKVLLYVAYNSLEEFERLFVPQVRTFWCVCGISHRADADATETQQKIQDMVEDMRYYMSVIQRNQKSIKHLLLTMDSDFSTMLSRIQGRLRTICGDSPSDAQRSAKNPKLV